MKRSISLFAGFLLVAGLLSAAGSLVLTPAGTAVEPFDIEVCLESPQSFSLSLFNDNTGDSTISLSYTTTAGVGSLVGPSSLTVADGATVPFDVQALPDSSSIIGDSFSAEVRASNTAASDTTTLRIHYSRITGWTTEDSSAIGTRFHAAAWHSGKIYEMGGDLYTGGHPLATGSTRIYDVAGGSWSSAPSMPDPAYGIDAAVLGDLIYVIGGSNCSDDPHDGCDSGSIFQTVRILDTGTATWSTDSADPLPTALAYASAVAAGGKIYLFGGLDSTAHSVSSVWVYDPAAGSGSRWTSGATMSSARAQAASALLGSKIYVAGGWDHGDLLLDTLDIYDPSSDSWSTGANMPAAMSSMAGTALDDRFLFLPTNEQVSSTYPNTSYTVGSVGFSYDRVEDRWFEDAGPIHPVYGTQVVSDGTLAWLISGREKPSVIDPFQQSTRIDLGSGCPVSTSVVIFADGFDDGTTNAWSGVN